MCGRARLSSDVSEIKVAFRIPPERPTPNIAPSWNVAPTPGIFLVSRARARAERLKNPFNLNLLRGDDQRRQGHLAERNSDFWSFLRGSARLKTRLLPTKCRSTLHFADPTAH